MITTESGYRDHLLGKSEAKARKRLSHRCPVIKNINKMLEKCKPMDLVHAIDIAKLAASELPEGEATVQVLDFIMSFDR